MRRFVPQLAGTLVTVAFELSVEHGWFSNAPEALIRFLWIVPLALWAWFGWTHERARPLRRWVAIMPSISLIAFLAAGAGLGACAWAWTVKTDRRERNRSLPTAETHAKTADSPAQSHAANTAAPQSEHPLPTGTSAPDSARIADGLAAIQKRLDAVVGSTGPLPPYSLGGSLDKGAFFEFLGVGPKPDRFVPVRDSRTAEVDWSLFQDVDLVADVTVRGGACRVAVIDADNDTQVSVSGWLPVLATDLTREQLPPPATSTEALRHVELPIPRVSGVKRYRLGVQPSTSRTLVDTFWISGEIAFPFVSFGGTLNAWFSPSEGEALIGVVPNTTDATIDWSRVRPPVNAVMAEVTIVIAYPVRGATERARARIIDLTDSTLVEGPWVDIIQGVGMGAGMAGYPPRKDTVRVLLPGKTGIHKYRLEVEVSKAGVKVAAAGRLLFRH